MGVIGMLPMIADQFQVNITEAGWVVSFFCASHCNFRSDDAVIVLAVESENDDAACARCVYFGKPSFRNHIKLHDFITLPRDSRLVSSGLCVIGFHGCGIVRQQGGSPQGGFENIRRRIRWDGTRRTCHESHCERNLF